jgi:hypothetical protein
VAQGELPQEVFLAKGFVIYQIVWLETVERIPVGV